jgi:hypothetical protein
MEKLSQWALSPLSDCPPLLVPLDRLVAVPVQPKCCRSHPPRMRGYWQAHIDSQLEPHRQAGTKPRILTNTLSSFALLNIEETAIFLVT